MAHGKVISFRPSVDLMGDVAMIQDWCRRNNSSLNSVINSFLPAIAYAVQFQTVLDPTNGNRYIIANFGDIKLREPHERSTP